MRKKKSNGFNLAELWQCSELRKRLLLTLFMLVAFRLGGHVPIPGTPQDLLAKNTLLTSNLMNMYDLFSGGTLQSLSIFALGIGPYISASIIIQLMTAVLPRLKELKEEGAHGQREIKRITRWLTLGLAFCESFGLARMVLLHADFASPVPLPLLFLVIVATLTASTMIIMCMGELITEKGIGNGSSLLICAGIVGRLPVMVRDTWTAVESNVTSPWAVALMMAVFVLCGAVAVLLQQSMKRLQILGGRAKPTKSTGMVGDTHLFLPLNPAGVMPIVFASQCLFFLHMFIAFLINQTGRLNAALMENKTLSPAWSSIASDNSIHSAMLAILTESQNIFDSAHWEYYILYTVLILFFSLFYSELMLPPRDIAESLRKSNRIIAGVRPGRATVDFLRKTIQKLAVIGAAAVAFIALLPTQVAQMTQVQSMLGFGSTSLIILTGVALDTQRQISAYASSSRYHKRYLLSPTRSDADHEIET